MSTAGASILGVGYLLPLVYFIWSLRYGKRAADNPWGATGLEWETPSPPPTENFPETPVVIGAALRLPDGARSRGGHWIAPASTRRPTTTRTRPSSQHHFVDLSAQRHASTLAMWMFLVTEVLFFGGMFTAYVVYRAAYRHAFEGASNLLDLRLGAINTAVLICSSLTMALAVWASGSGRKRATILFLVGTLLLGGAFLGIKTQEYSQKFQHHEVPGPHFVVPLDEETHRPLAPQSEMFFSLYFCMTGLHALHMIIGIGLLTWLIVKARARRVLAALQHAGRSGRALLALRRHRLDLPLPAALSPGEAHAVSAPQGAAFGATPKAYFAVFAALMALTGLTVWASFLHLGVWNTPVALAIAVTKALLVALVFMHLRHSPRLTRFVIGASILWLALLIVITASDFLTRAWLPIYGR